jgi:D-alanyl-lipoteichoic acid acyltransferase DltB (MBOAT superfamily)
LLFVVSITLLGAGTLEFCTKSRFAARVLRRVCIAGLAFQRDAGMLYGIAITVARCGKALVAAQKKLAVAGVTASVINLAVFKYFDFFREGFQLAAAALQSDWVIPALDIILPVGISFYTFQAIAYIVAVGRNERDPANPLDSALYLAFFPTLMAGPICRPDTLLAQIEEKTVRQIRQPDRIFWLLLSALIKKSGWQAGLLQPGSIRCLRIPMPIRVSSCC